MMAITKPQLDRLNSMTAGERNLVKNMNPGLYAAAEKYLGPAPTVSLEYGVRQAGRVGEPIPYEEPTKLTSMTDMALFDPNIVAIRPAGRGNGSESQIYYKDGTSKFISKEQGGGFLYYLSPDLVRAEQGGSDTDTFYFADGTTAEALNPSSQHSGNFFDDQNWCPYLIGGAYAAVAAYVAVPYVLGAAAGAAEGGLDAAMAASAASSAGELGAMGGAGAGAAGAGTAGLTTGLSETAGMTAAEIAAEGAPYGYGAAQAVTQAAAQSGVTLTAEQAAAATTQVATGAAGAGAGGAGAAGAWTAGQYLQAANLAITAVTTGAAMLGGGDKTATATTTTTPTGPGSNPMPGGGGGTAGAATFEDYINDFYGLAGDKSVKTRTSEDQVALEGYQKALLDSLTGLDTKHLADTRAAVLPYQNQLTDIGNQLAGNTGLGKQVAFGFGGKQMASFVPKTNRDLANQLLGIGREGSQINTGLVDMGYKSGTDLATRQFGFNSENLPNKAADTYSAKLEALMKYLNPNSGSTSTTTGTVPGVPWYTTLLQGLNTGVNLWSAIENPRTNTSTSTK
jgi:hypothetical protein